MGVIEIKELTKQLLVDLNAAKVKLGLLGKFDATAIKAAYDIILSVINSIEVYSAEVQKLTSDEKKQAAVEMINSLLDIPFIPEFIEEKLISFVVDFAIHVFNQIGGKIWITTLFGKKIAVQ